MELLREKGIEVLYLLDRVDELAIEALHDYKDKKFQSISRGDLKLDGTDALDAKMENERLTEENDSLISAVKEQLAGRVAEVKISNRLKSSPACLVSGDAGISLSTEQILSEMDKAGF